MKKILFICIGAFSLSLNAQILTNTLPANSLDGSNVILDASTNYSAEAGEDNSKHKGIIIPSVDLVNFEFDLTLADGVTFPTYFDGMMVYNNATGNTLTTGNRPSTGVAVTPGYYYFSNPNGSANGSITAGIWKPMGGSGNIKVTVSDALAGTPTNMIVAGDKEVYAIRGQFTTTGTSTAVTLAKPDDISSFYRITIYKDGQVFGSSVYSYDKGTGAAFTGAPGMSVVYPAATYDYVLEYLK